MGFVLFLTTRFLFFFFFFSNFINTFVSRTRHLCRPDQRDALMEFKSEFEVDPLCQFVDENEYPQMKSWVNNTDCCSWDGITCNANSGQVMELDLTSSCLFGQLNSKSSLYKLQKLRVLNLARNNFNNSMIPTQFSKLMELRRLNLSQSLFYGQIPTELLQLTKLVSLDLSSGFTVGKSFLTKLVQNLTNLEELNLSKVNISSEIPQNISNLSSLKSLYLDDCNMFGNFPSNLFSIPTIQSIVLSNNHYMEGSLPEFNGNNSLVSLDLSSTSLSGNIPDSINNLKHLTTLILKSCKLYGKIPSSLGNLSNFSYLDLSKNDFSGHIPSSIGNLSHLTYLDLSSNIFDGEIPSSFGGLTLLTSLDVNSNKLSGNFPLPLLNLTKLSYLNFSCNQLTGTLPPNMSSFSSLEDFHANQNSFFGTIPSTLFTIPSLELLDLSDNQFNGTLGFDNISSPFYLKALDDLDKNSFSSLSELYLSNNRITGPVPGWLWSLTNLTIVLLSNNSFSGFEGFTKDFSGEVFWILDLRSNDFQGPLFVPPRPANFLLASRNNFSGEIPISICDMTTLQILDIANNNLNGSAPDCLRKLIETSLSVLDLGDNHFTGSLPDIFTNASNLRSLNVGHNHFTGKLPRSLIGCSSLEVLNVEHNRLNDTFPVWLQPLKTLQVLILRSNEFQGLLLNHSRGLSWFPKLRIIDILHNDFTGTLPSDFFMQWSAMSSKGDRPKLKYIGDNTYYHDSMDLMNKGVNLEYTRIFTLLTTIDFSGNRLQGNIPESIGLLKDLIVLNLSTNGFNGDIPSSLANLTQLEPLDLSHNKLSGQIPPAFKDLTKLSFIMVSDNKLVGPIPQSTQFQTQSGSSFEENLGLCGPPLEGNCGGLDTKEPETVEKEEEEVLSWTAATIGVAPGVIFGLTIGHLVITHKHQWSVKKQKR